METTHKESNWEKHEHKVESYINEDKDLVIYIIKTGFTDLYIITYDDPHKQHLGDCEVLCSQGIERKYGIKVQI